MTDSVHHLGCLVEDIQTAIEDYRVMYPNASVSSLFEIDAVKATVCFFETSNISIEFVQPTDTGTSLYRMLEDNPGFYHIGKYVVDIDKEIQRLQDNRYRLINKFSSPAFGNKYCAFLYNQEMHLVELIEL